MRSHNLWPQKLRLWFNFGALKLTECCTSPIFLDVHDTVHPQADVWSKGANSSHAQSQENPSRRKLFQCVSGTRRGKLMRYISSFHNYQLILHFLAGYFRGALQEHSACHSVCFYHHLDFALQLWGQLAGPIIHCVSFVNDPSLSS